MPRLTMLVIGWCLAAGASAAQEPQFVSISAGLLHTCALDQEGQAYCWGVNDGGQLGTSVSETCPQDEGQLVPCSRRPVRVPTEARFVQLTAGEWHTCALTPEGDAWCWGAPVYHLLGADSVPASAGSAPRPPVRAAIGTRFLTLSAGSYHTCGLTTDTLVVCWGRNDVGQLGNDSMMESCPSADPSAEPGAQLACRRTPLRVDVGTPLLEVEAGAYHACALDVAGTVHCWGWWIIPARTCWIEGSYARQLKTATPLHGLDCGVRMSVALSQEGLPYQWGCVPLREVPGFTVFGQNAISEPEFPADPSKVRQSGPFFVTAVSGDRHRCGLTAEGVAYCWGHNESGQLGAGHRRDIHVYRDDKWKPGLVAGRLTFRTLTAGGSHTCGLTSDNRAYCWGQNNAGQLGIGTTKDQRKPMPVMAPAQP